MSENALTVDVREVMAKMSPEERNSLILQMKAFEKFGEKGEDLAIDLLMENPGLSESGLFRQLEQQLTPEQPPTTRF